MIVDNELLIGKDLEVKLRNDREDFLLDTLEFYDADPKNRRAFNPIDLTCTYSPIKGKKGNEGCAIGRHLSRHHQNKFDNFETDASWRGVKREAKRGNIKIPKYLINLDGNGVGNFLGRIQQLHDGSAFWNKDQISGRGVAELKEIIINFGLRKSKFKKYFQRASYKERLELIASRN